MNCMNGSSLRQISEERDQIAHDRQHDWEPAGAGKAGEERV